MRIERFFFLSILVFSSHLYAFSPYSNEELDTLEKTFVEAINQSPQVERDPLIVQSINQIGKKLSAFAEISSPYFFIVKSPEINAFAGPGGYIGINTQLILAAANESELAAVMAHELAHVRLHHLYRFIEHQKQMRIPMIASILAAAALGVVNPTLGSGALMATMGGMAQDSINFTRSNEKEADRIGIDMLIKAGFNPHAMSAFFKKMQQNARYYYTANIPPILRSHPLDAERIAEADNRAAFYVNRKEESALDFLLLKVLVQHNTTTNKKELLTFYGRCSHKDSPQACQYGLALVNLSLNRNTEAFRQFQSLTQETPDNLFYSLGLIQSLISLNQYEAAISEADKLYKTHPQNYAVITAYANSLEAGGKAEQGAMILTKGFRLFKKDLLLCEALARIHNAAHHPNYAYFIEAQCQELQGKNKAALESYKIARTLSKKDPYLSARIQASIDNLKNQ